MVFAKPHPRLDAAWRFLLVLLLIAIATGACSTPTGGGLVPDPRAMEKGEHIDRIRVDEAALRSVSPGSIVLGDVDTSRVSDQDGVTRQEAAASLVAGFSPAVGGKEIVAMHGSAEDLILELAIVELSIGDAGVRMMMGEFGAGHAWVQVDGRVIDPNTGQVVIELAERRRGSGDIGLRDLGGDSGPAMIREMLNETGERIRAELEGVASQL